MIHEKNYEVLRKLSNSGRYRKAYQLARKWRSEYPDQPTYAYCEAVYYGDDEDGRGKREIAQRHKTASLMLRKLLRRLRSLPERTRNAVRNEYYWFSHQPKKQYQLGKELVKKGNARAHYCQGVGAAEVARRYFEKGKSALGERWARTSEKAWTKFFQEDSKWYNSYCWYARSIGFQGRVKEMERALSRASKISGKPLNAQEFEEVRNEVDHVLRLRNSFRKK